MNKKELLNKKIEELLKLDLKKDNSKALFEDIKNNYSQIIETKVDNYISKDFNKDK